MSFKFRSFSHQYSKQKNTEYSVFFYFIFSGRNTNFSQLTNIWHPFLQNTYKWIATPKISCSAGFWLGFYDILNKKINFSKKKDPTSKENKMRSFASRILHFLFLGTDLLSNKSQKPGNTIMNFIHRYHLLNIHEKTLKIQCFCHVIYH